MEKSPIQVNNYDLILGKALQANLWLGGPDEHAKDLAQ